MGVRCLQVLLIGCQTCLHRTTWRILYFLLLKIPQKHPTCKKILTSCRGSQTLPDLALPPPASSSDPWALQVLTTAPYTRAFVCVVPPPGMLFLQILNSLASPYPHRGNLHLLFTEAFLGSSWRVTPFPELLYISLFIPSSDVSHSVIRPVCLAGCLLYVLFITESLVQRTYQVNSC